MRSSRKASGGFTCSRNWVWRWSKHSLVDDELEKRRGRFCSFFSKADLGKKWSLESPEPVHAVVRCVPAQSILTSGEGSWALWQCTEQPSLGTVVSPLFLAVKFLRALPHQPSEVAQAVRCIWCQTCSMPVEHLYKMGVQGPGSLGTALLYSAAPVQQGCLTREHGQKVFVEVSNEDGRCTWPQSWFSGTGTDDCRHVTSLAKDKGLNLSFWYTVA